jgi:hypothetical protein
MEGEGRKKPLHRVQILHPLSMANRGEEEMK